MRILHVVNDYFSHMSGYAIRTNYIARFQREMGLQPVVIVAPYHNYIGDSVGRIGKVILVDGVQFHQIGMHPSMARTLIRLSPWLYRRTEGMLLEQYILRVVKRNSGLPDLIHAHSPHLVGWPALRAARHLGLPFVYEMRGLWEESAVANGRFSENSLRYRFHRFQETRLASRSDGLVTISDALCQEMSRRGAAPQETVVIPNGVDPERFPVGKRVGRARREVRRQLGIKDNIVLLGYIGSLRHYENLDDIIQAVALLRQRKVTIKFILVGDGEAKPDLEGLVKELCLNDQVIFVGKVPHREVNRYYGAIDIFVVARKSRHVALVMPLKPLEAMAMAKPLIVADLPVMHEIVQDGVNGLFYPAGDVEALMGKVLELVKDPALRVAMGQNARTWILENYTWDKVVSRYLEFYERVLLTHAYTPKLRLHVVKLSVWKSNS